MPLLQIPIFLSHCKFLITGFLGRPRLQGARRYTPRFWVTASPATPTTSPPEGTTERGPPKPWCQPQGKLSPIKTILLFQILFSTSTSFNFYKSIGVTWLNLWEIGMRFEKENKFWRDFCRKFYKRITNREICFSVGKSLSFWTRLLHILTDPPWGFFQIVHRNLVFINLFFQDFGKLENFQNYFCLNVLNKFLKN